MRQVEIKWHTPEHSVPCPGCEVNRVHKMNGPTKKHPKKTHETACGFPIDSCVSMRAWRAVSCGDCHSARLNNNPESPKLKSKEHGTL
jgi:hypothetical protein